MNETAASNIPDPVAERVLATVADWTDEEFRLAFGFDREAPTTDRTYAIGIPLAITVKDDGAIVLDFDLTEAEQVGDDYDAYDAYGEEQVIADSRAVRQALQGIGNHHSITITPTA